MRLLDGDAHLSMRCRCCASEQSQHHRLLCRYWGGGSEEKYWLIVDALRRLPPCTLVTTPDYTQYPPLDLTVALSAGYFQVFEVSSLI